MMKNPLISLAELILQNAHVLESNYAKRGVEVPSLDDPYVVGSDLPLDEPVVQKASSIMHAAAQQLLHTIRPPQLSLLYAVTQLVVPAAIRCASEFHISEILSDAGSDGLHIKDIAVRCGADPLKIGPILRCLASNWIFKEVKPDIFSNNRLSSVLHKGQSAEVLQKNPDLQYDKPESALAASLCLYSDDIAKSASVLYETLSDSTSAFSREAGKCAMARAFDFSATGSKSTWEFYEMAEQHARRKRFGVAMEGVKRRDPVGLVTRAFEWETLPIGGIVADVGGGFGAMSVEIAKTYPNLKLVVQDIAGVVSEGYKRWEGLEPDIIKAGRVSFQAHNFFEQQPISAPAAFFMKHIVHDWADPFALQILKRLREAAGSETKLFVMEKIVPHTCLTSGGKDSDEEVERVSGELSPELPEIITNVSGGNTYPHLASIAMMLHCNGQERTLKHIAELFREARWKVVSVRQFDPLSQVSSGICAEPI